MTNHSVSDNDTSNEIRRRWTNLLQDGNFCGQRLDVLRCQTFALDALDGVLLPRWLVNRVADDGERARSDHLAQRVLLFEAVWVRRVPRRFGRRSLFVHSGLLLRAVRRLCADHFIVLYAPIPVPHSKSVSERRVRRTCCCVRPSSSSWPLAADALMNADTYRFGAHAAHGDVLSAFVRARCCRVLLLPPIANCPAWSLFALARSILACGTDCLYVAGDCIASSPHSFRR